MSVETTLDVQKQGDRFQVAVGPILRNSRWVAGTWVMYVEGSEDFTVEKSDGIYACGFLLYGSENYSDPRTSTYRNYTSYQNIGTYSEARGGNVVTLVTGGGRFLFHEYEPYALNAQGVRDPNTSISFTLNENLKISENGLLCNDPDARLLLATGGQQTLIVGVCSKIPTASSPMLGLDLKY